MLAKDKLFYAAEIRFWFLDWSSLEMRLDDDSGVVDKDGKGNDNSIKLTLKLSRKRKIYQQGQLASTRILAIRKLEILHV